MTIEDATDLPVSLVARHIPTGLERFQPSLETFDKLVTEASGWDAFGTKSPPSLISTSAEKKIAIPTAGKEKLTEDVGPSVYGTAPDGRRDVSTDTQWLNDGPE